MARLNPNAAEFIPSARRSTIVSTKDEDSTRDVSGASGKAILGRSESNVSNNSDDEVHQYWRLQLPDDITPDFKFMAQDESQGHEHVSISGLSIHDATETPRFCASEVGESLVENLGYSSLTYGENYSSAANSWDNEFIDSDRYFMNGREGQPFNGDPSSCFMNDLLGNESVASDSTVDPVEFLASQFPGFSAESLAEVYYANGCDLNLTIEILTQLELQVDGGLSQKVSSNALTSPSFNVMDFPALPVIDAQTGDLSTTYRSPSSIPRGAADFASTVRKLASQEPGQLNYQRNGSLGGRRNSQLQSSSYTGNEKLVSGDKLRTSGTARAAPVWLETGAAVASMYSESREEARDFARLRNACFEQARDAYLIGNKALAKELSVKGHVYSMKMKEAHGKARETIYRQRNSGSTGQDPLIDLHGLHVSEAIHVLKHELGTLRSTARSAGKRLQVMICVGTGHHTKGTRTPARLPVAVEQYLAEEGLHYTQPQPGLLRVVIY